MSEETTPQAQEPQDDDTELSSEELEDAAGGSINNSCTNGSCAAAP